MDYRDFEARITITEVTLEGCMTRFAVSAPTRGTKHYETYVEAAQYKAELLREFS